MLGEFLRARREFLGKNQAALAAEIGITRAYLSQIETGRVGLPGVMTRRALAEALGVSHVALLVAAGELAAEEISAERAAPPMDEAAQFVEMAERLDAEDRAVVLQMGRMLAENRRRRALGHDGGGGDDHDRRDERVQEVGRGRHG